MNLMELVVIGIMFVVLGFALSIGQTMLTQLRSTQSSVGGGDYAYNTTGYAQSGINTLSYWMPTLALAIIAGIIISVLLGYMLGAVTGGRRAAI